MNKMSLLAIPDKAYFDPLYGQANLMRIAGLKSKLMDLLWEAMFRIHDRLLDMTIVTWIN